MWLLVTIRKGVNEGNLTKITSKTTRKSYKFEEKIAMPFVFKECKKGFNFC